MRQKTFPETRSIFLREEKTATSMHWVSTSTSQALNKHVYFLVCSYVLHSGEFPRALTVFSAVFSLPSNPSAKYLVWRRFPFLQA